MEARQKLKMWQDKLKIAAVESIEKKAKLTEEEKENMYTKESRVEQYR